jgi:hypothetical protein
MATRNAPYQGHKNWTHWNVALWISNDEPTYNEAVRLTRKIAYCKHGSFDCAARLFKQQLSDRTPDGARYSISAIRAALIGLEIDP